MKKFIFLIFTLLVSSNAYAMNMVVTKFGEMNNSNRKSFSNPATVYKSKIFLDDQYTYLSDCLNHNGDTVDPYEEDNYDYDDYDVASYYIVSIMKRGNEKYDVYETGVKKTEWNETLEDVDAEECVTKSTSLASIWGAYHGGYRITKAEYNSDTFKCKKHVVDICFDTQTAVKDWDNPDKYSKSNPKIIEGMVNRDNFISQAISTWTEQRTDTFEEVSEDEFKRVINIPVSDILNFSKREEINWDAVKKGL